MYRHFEKRRNVKFVARHRQDYILTVKGLESPHIRRHCAEVDRNAIRLVWDRIEGFALGVREQVGNPKIYENFEAMAKANEG